MAVSDTIVGAGTRGRPKLDARFGVASTSVFVVLLAGGIVYAAQGFLGDIHSVNENLALGVFALLGLALLIALGFEFVNGFHDTANAVATVIYTHSHGAASSRSSGPVYGTSSASCFRAGAVAYGIITLVAGRTDPSGRQQGRLRDDLCAADSRDPLESRYLGARHPQQFATR